MTKRAIATQAQVRRNIKAARLEGLHVAAIKPDGTIIISDGDFPISPTIDLDDKSPVASKWEDIEA
jgi:hypothetical protein